MNPFEIGEIIHGFAGGYFGRDSYACRRVEAVGVDWVVTRAIEPNHFAPAVELVTGAQDLAGLKRATRMQDVCEEC